MKFAVNMQFLLFISLFFFSLALGSPADVHYLEQLVEDEAQLFDAKDFAGFANLFTKNATYNPDTTNVYGMNNIEKILSRVFLSEVISQSAVKTKSFALLPTFNGQGAAGTATGTVYTTVSFIGQGNLTGQVYTVFAEHNDMYVKTEQFARYGGWKISERFFVEFVRCPQKRMVDLVTVCPILMLTDRSLFDFPGRPRWQSRHPSDWCSCSDLAAQAK